MFRHLLQLEMEAGEPGSLDPVERLAQPSQADFERCIPLLSAHRLYGLADLAVRRGYPFSPSQREQLATGQRAATITALMAERSALWVDDVLGAAGIEYRLTKGLVTGRLIYDDPSIRQSGDVDAFVADDELDRAARALIAAGATRLVHELRPGWDARFAKGIVVVTPDEVEIDLRRTMAVGSYGHRVDGSMLLTGPGHQIELGGRSLPTLEPAALLVNACYRLLSWKRRLSTVRDIAQFAHVRGDLIPPALAIADRWRGRAAMIRAFEEADRWIPLPEQTRQLVLANRPSLADRMELAAYRPTIGKVAIRIEDLAHQANWPDRGAYIQGLIRPSAEHRRRHGHPATQLAERLLRPTRDRSDRR